MSTIGADGDHGSPASGRASRISHLMTSSSATESVPASEHWPCRRLRLAARQWSALYSAGRPISARSVSSTTTDREERRRGGAPPRSLRPSSPQIAVPIRRPAVALPRYGLRDRSCGGATDGEGLPRSPKDLRYAPIAWGRRPGGRWRMRHRAKSAADQAREFDAIHLRSASPSWRLHVSARDEQPADASRGARRVCLSSPHVPGGGGAVFGGGGYRRASADP